jgi:DNA end-binding protein Ku
MARPIWKGSISFGLVNIPISLYSAEQKTEMHFKLLDKRDKSEIHYEKVSAETGKQVPSDQIVKGFKYRGGDYILVTDEDLKKAAVEATQIIEISDFVTLSSIEYMFFEKPYYVLPEKKAEKGYVLLREVLKRTGKVGISKVVIRSRQYLCALIPEGDGLILDILRFPDEIRDLTEFQFPSEGIEKYKISDKEMQIAEMLVENMTSQWDPKQYHDEYREAVMGWIEKKAEARGEMPAPEEEAQESRTGAKVVDMMDLLKRSVQMASQRRGKEQAGERTENAA